MPTLEATDWIALASAGVSLIALLVAIYAVKRSNRNSSVATLVTLNEAFRQAWQRYLEAPEAAKFHAFSELANLTEIACSIHLEKSLFGVSRELSLEYTEQVILLIEGNEDARRRLEAAIDSPKTFKYIALFRADMRKRSSKIGKYRQDSR